MYVCIDVYMYTLYICIYVHLYVYACMYTIYRYVYYMYMYIYVYMDARPRPPPTRGNALLGAQISTEPQIQKSQSSKKFKKLKIPKSEHLKIQESKTFHICVVLQKVWIFGVLEF